MTRDSTVELDGNPVGRFSKLYKVQYQYMSKPKLISVFVHRVNYSSGRITSFRTSDPNITISVHSLSKWSTTPLEAFNKALLEATGNAKFHIEYGQRYTREAKKLQATKKKHL